MCADDERVDDGDADEDDENKDVVTDLVRLESVSELEEVLVVVGVCWVGECDGDCDRLLVRLPQELLPMLQLENECMCNAESLFDNMMTMKKTTASGITSVTCESSFLESNNLQIRRIRGVEKKWKLNAASR